MRFEHCGHGGACVSAEAAVAGGRQLQVGGSGGAGGGGGGGGRGGLRRWQWRAAQCCGAVCPERQRWQWWRRRGRLVRWDSCGARRRWWRRRGRQARWGSCGGAREQCARAAAQPAVAVVAAAGQAGALGQLWRSAEQCARAAAQPAVAVVAAAGQAGALGKLWRSARAVCEGSGAASRGSGGGGGAGRQQLRARSRVFAAAPCRQRADPRGPAHSATMAAPCDRGRTLTAAVAALVCLAAVATHPVHFGDRGRPLRPWPHASCSIATVAAGAAAAVAV